MKKSISVDSRIKSKIESLVDLSRDENNICYLVKFKDIDDTFIFGSDTDLYNFMGIQIRERFYDKELRIGYFDYINENGETLRYHVESQRGAFISVKDENIGIVNK
jgi:hypothetical protein